MIEKIRGIKEKNTYTPRNLWKKEDLFPVQGNALLSFTVAPHDALLLKLN